MQINVNDIQSVVYDGQEVEHFYVGADLVWEKPSGATPLTFTNAQSGASTVKIRQEGTDTSGKVIYYKLNGGAETQYTIGDVITLTSQGDYVQFYSKDEIAMAKSETSYKNFVMTGTIEGSGDIQSLMNYTYDLTGKDYCYAKLFYDCSSLTTSPELTATTLSIYCYTNMFYNCSGLTAAPNLDAEEVTIRCYSYMFVGCSSMRTAPERLMATKLPSSCYERMFQNCTSLVTAPQFPDNIVMSSDGAFFGTFDNTRFTSVMENTTITIQSGRGYGMAECFQRCTNLTRGPKEIKGYANGTATLVNTFSDCTSLTTAPVLDVILKNRGAEKMFKNCSSLTELKVKMTSLTSTSNWLSGVASTGTVHFLNGLDAGYTPPTGASGVPEGWTYTTN